MTEEEFNEQCVENARQALAELHRTGRPAFVGATPEQKKFHDTQTDLIHGGTYSASKIEDPETRGRELQRLRVLRKLRRRMNRLLSLSQER